MFILAGRRLNVVGRRSPTPDALRTINTVRWRRLQFGRPADRHSTAPTNGLAIPPARTPSGVTAPVPRCGGLRAAGDLAKSK